MGGAAISRELAEVHGTFCCRGKIIMMRVLLLATALATLAPIAAHAGSITVTGYDLPDGDAYGDGLINGYSYYDGPIVLHVQGGSDITVYCADLNHELQSGAGYSYGLLTQNGQGDPISQPLSNRIGHIAQLGFAALGADGFMASAAQLAIWSLEYDATPTIYNGFVQTDFDELLTDTFINNGSYATALIPDGGWPATLGASQQMVVGLASGVPEPSTWAMGLMGFAGVVGLSLFNRRKAARCIEA
jgi:PEP-CTERM motif